MSLILKVLSFMEPPSSFGSQYNVAFISDLCNFFYATTNPQPTSDFHKIPCSYSLSIKVRILTVWDGLVPQHPPTMVAPAAIQSATWAA